MGISSLSGEGTDYINASYIMVSQLTALVKTLSHCIAVFRAATYLSLCNTVLILKVPFFHYSLCLKELLPPGIFITVFAGFKFG